MLIKRNVIITTDDGGGNPLAAAIATAASFETGTGVLATDECGNPFPAFTETPELQIRSLGDYQFVLVPTALDATSDVVSTTTGGHKFRIYVGSVGVAPSDGNYKAHLLWVRC